MVSSRVSNTNSFREKSRIRLEQNYTSLNFIMKLIQEGNYHEAVVNVLSSLPKRARIEVTYDLFTNSSYKSFRIKMKKFKDFMQEYFDKGKVSKEDYDNYYDSLYGVEGDYFAAIAWSILEDLWKDQPNSSHNAILTMIPQDQKVNDLTCNYYKSVLKKLLVKRWPDNKGLEVLF